MIDRWPQPTQCIAVPIKRIKPRPFAASKLTRWPSACGTTRMSENMIAASKPKAPYRLQRHLCGQLRIKTQARGNFRPFREFPDIPAGTGRPAASARLAERKGFRQQTPAIAVYPQVYPTHRYLNQIRSKESLL